MNWGITCQSPPCKTLFLYTYHTEIKAHTSILSLMCLRASAVPWKSSSSGMVTKSNFSFGLHRLVKIWWNCVSAESSTIIMISGKKLTHGHVIVVNPLSPSSDQHQISPNNIHTLSRDKLWELIKWSHKRKCLDLLSNSLHSFFKEMYRDQFGEFVCVYWGLKG